MSAYWLVHKDQNSRRAGRCNSAYLAEEDCFPAYRPSPTRPISTKHHFSQVNTLCL